MPILYMNHRTMKNEELTYTKSSTVIGSAGSDYSKSQLPPVNLNTNFLIIKSCKISVITKSKISFPLYWCKFAFAVARSCYSAILRQPK